MGNEPGLCRRGCALGRLTFLPRPAAAKAGSLLGIPSLGLRVLPSSPRSRSRWRGLGQPSPEPVGRAPFLPPGAPRGQPTPTRQPGTGEPPGGDGAPLPSRFPQGRPDRFTMRPPPSRHPGSAPGCWVAGMEGLETETQGTEWKAGEGTAEKGTRGLRFPTGPGLTRGLHLPTRSAVWLLCGGVFPALYQPI